VAIATLDNHTQEAQVEARIAKCQPILAEFQRIQAVRNDKRTRFERLLVQQEEGLIPFDSTVVDYEYRVWMVQETELDRRGDDLVEDMRLLNCQSPGGRE